MKKLSGLILSLLMVLFSGCSDQKKVIYLDELDITQMEAGWGENHINKSVEGNRLKIAGIEYDRGIGTHAVSKFVIALNGNAINFKALAGVDDESGSQASVEFMVLGDRKILWRSGVMKKGDPAREADVNLRGITKMALLVTDGGDNINYDHADWINARIDYRGLAPEVPKMKAKEPYILTPPPGDAPRINGSSVIGANPGHPFIFRVAVTGKKPITIEVGKLPAGLVYDSQNRILTGKAPVSGTYPVLIKASNEAGTTEKTITIRTGSGLALTPPLGWNSWNCWGLSIDQDKVMAAADAMVNSGLADHGWTFINFDDGWEAEKRTASGELLANGKFPDMKVLADYVHGKGLRMGIYSSPGPKTCGGFLGSYRNEWNDVKTWSGWGIDYVKYDWCSYGQIARDQSLPELKKPYELMRTMLDRADRDIIFSLCQYGMGNVWEWGQSVGGNLWRTTGDITDSWNSMAGIGFSQDNCSPYTSPGHWNDPDMLVVGKVGWGPSLHPSRLTPDEQYTHISLWAMLAAPLLIGCDMSQMDDFTLNLLTNDEVLEINQDPLGKSALPVKKGNGFEVWTRPLADGSLAVGIFNIGNESGADAIRWDDQPEMSTIALTSVDLGISGDYRIRDVWRQMDLGSFKGQIEAGVPFHGVNLLRLIPVK